jgi:hypothetical protein
MSTRIKDNQLIFQIPNSEAISVVQRGSILKRCVCNFYLSKKDAAVETFLNGCSGSFYVDLAASYALCKAPFMTLIENCSSLYRNKLTALKATLDSIERMLATRPDSLLFSICPPSILRSRKYIKFGDSSLAMSYFRTLCLGDITQIIVRKMAPSSFLIYVRPFAPAVASFSNPADFQKWLDDNTLAK